MVVGPAADFSSLPYFNGVPESEKARSPQDVNPDIANVSEEIVSTPFENQNLLLKKGIHLHWALPDALTRATDRQGVQDFPAVPNRWLITRRNGTGEKRWIVESDFLAASQENENAGSVTVPYRNDSFQPFRYIGRTLQLDGWREDSAGPDLKLTALGYGEPTFAAFYPNCHSVFGFFDPDPPAALEGTRYEVVGWYSKQDQDYLKLFVGDRNSKTVEEKKQDLERECRWTVTLPDGKAFPDRLICFAQLGFGSGTQAGKLSGDCTIAVGNTGTEALSAYLAAKIDSDQQIIIEDQLEALQLTSQLEPRLLDVGPKFFEARHEKGFTAIPGGLLWSIRSEAQSGGAADASNAETEITLPPEMAVSLNALNVQQQNYDHGMQEIESLRKQLFSDWYKYMLCAYPPEDSKDDYPNIDEVGSYLDFNIDSLQIKIESAQAQEAELNKAIARLQTEVTQHNQNLPSVKSAFTLKQVSGPRYWQPREPVVLIIGPVAKASERHGQDGRLRDDGLLETQILEDIDLGKIGGNDLTQTAGILNDISQKALEKLKNSGKENIAFSTWSAPWNPFQLEWEVEVFPIQNKSNLDLAAGGYASDFISQNYSLNVNEPEFSEQDTAVPAEAANLYSGRSILTPHASILLKRQIEAYLKRGSWLFVADDIVSAKQLCERLRKGSEPLSRYWVGKFPQSAVFDTSKSLPEESDLVAIVVAQLNQLITDPSLPGKPPDAIALPADASDELKLAELMRTNRRLIEQVYDREITQTSADTWQAYARIRESYDLLNDSAFHCLSQSLGGFNEALLMHKQTMQLMIADPLGFDEYPYLEVVAAPIEPLRTLSLADRVSAAVKDSIHSAPQPLNDFNPIRSGRLSLLRLRLIDTFGQVIDLLPQETITSQPLAPQKNVPSIRLAPRLVAPARLNFRWLAARGDAQEMNDHPATTPVCGWLLTNHLDNSVMIYDGEGKALGSIMPKVTAVPEERWQPAPGSDTRIEGITNPHLQKLVKYICRLDADSKTPAGEDERFLSLFISAIDNALENIEPENFAQHQDLALLMGRPIALVRASLNLELQGLPAVHQGWNVFRQDLLRETRDDNGFTDVQFPIRIGEYKQFNDGLVGYWQEEGGGDYAGDNFHALQSDEIPHPNIRTHGVAASEMIFYQTVNAEPQVVSMLIDPRGVVHATSGVLPAKVIGIPPDQYVDALQAIEITFLTVPILTAAGKIHLPLPTEAGYQWSWLQKQNGTWSEVSARGVVAKQVFEQKFGAAADGIWQELKQQQWIKKIDDSKASVTATDKRLGSLGKALADKVPAIEDILDRAQIGPIDPTARFSGPQELREGWLKLSADRTNGKSTNASE